MIRTPQPDVSSFLAETVDAVHDRVDLTPRVGVVVGAEIGGFSERLRNAVRIPTGSLPHLPAGTDLSLGFVDDVPVACLEGRVHLGEGLPTWQLVHGVRTLARLGVKTVLIAEAVGILEPTWNVGDLMVVIDHLNLTSHGSLGGIAGDEAFETFPSMRATYDPTLRAALDEVVRAENSLSTRIGTKTHLELVEGIYAGLPDPSYETPAQMRMLRALGAHVIGVGATVLEVLAFRQLGVRVVALSHLSYRAVDSSEPVDDETSRSSVTHFHRLVRGWILRADRA